MKQTKIDWCDCTINPVVGCPNGCKYCYAERMNRRFGWVKNWRVPQFFPERLNALKSKKPKSVFIDSMSDIGTWEQEWLNAVLKAINDNPQHRYVALTKCFHLLNDKLNRSDSGVVTNLWCGMSVTTQANANAIMLIHRFHGIMPDFYSIEPILEPIEIPNDAIPKTLIIGAETGNRKGKIIPQREWIDSLVKQADAHNCIVFMKESLRKIMGDDFRQDRLPWEVADEPDNEQGKRGSDGQSGD